MSRILRIDESQVIKQGGTSITVTADPLEIEVDPLELGLEPAQAIAQSIANGIRNVTAVAAPSTLRKRRARGILSDKRWNATGELARSIGVNQDGEGYAVTIPNHQQDPGMLERLAADVPAIDEPTSEVDAAIERTADEMIKVGR